LGSCTDVCVGGQNEGGKDLSTCPDIFDLAFWEYDTDPSIMGTGGGGPGTFKESATARINYVFNNWPSGGSKGFLAWLNIEDNKISEVSSEVTDAHPDIGLAYGRFGVDLLSDDQDLIMAFELWDPRIELGDEGVYSDDVNFPVRFPWYKNLGKFNITDKTTGELLITVDLTDTIDNYCRENENDPDCDDDRGNGGGNCAVGTASSPSGWLLAVLVLGCIALIRRRRR
jgi:MYXO-CTERM domain-containing protein